MVTGGSNLLFHGDDLRVDGLLLFPHDLHVTQQLGHILLAHLKVLVLNIRHLGEKARKMFETMT